MKKARNEAPALDVIERDFRDALARLQGGIPRDKNLKSAQKRGRLKINFAAVAQEAGRSRTLIALKDCRYPATRELILQAIEGRCSSPRTSSELIDNLRARLAEVRVLLHNAQAQTLEHFNQREAAEREAKRWKSAYDRLLAKTDTERRDNVLSFQDVNAPF